MEFTETESPQLVQRPPQIVLVARDLDGRTDAALSYLTENDLPVTVLKVTIYQDTKGRRFIEAGNFRIISVTEAEVTTTDLATDGGGIDQG
jgi:hypothetical protein